MAKKARTPCSFWGAYGSPGIPVRSHFTRLVLGGIGGTGRAFCPLFRSAFFISNTISDGGSEFFIWELLIG